MREQYLNDTDCRLGKSASSVGNFVSPTLSNEIVLREVRRAIDVGNTPEMRVSRMTHVSSEEANPIASGTLPSRALSSRRSSSRLEKLPNVLGSVPTRLFAASRISWVWWSSGVQNTPIHCIPHGSPVPQFSLLVQLSPPVASYRASSWSISSRTMAEARHPSAPTITTRTYPVLPSRDISHKYKIPNSSFLFHRDEK